MNEAGTYASVTTDDGFTIGSNTESAETMAANFAPVEEATDDAPAETAAAEPAAETAAVAEPVDPVLERNDDGTFKQKAKKGTVNELRQNIAKATWEREEEKRRADKLEARIAELTAQAKPVEQPKPVVAAQTDDAKPDPKKYPAEEYDPKYLQDYSDWRVREGIREFQAAQQQVEANRSFLSDQRRIEEAGLKEWPDFNSQVQKVVDAKLVFPPPLVEMIFTSPLGHRLAYEYATHLDDLRRLSALSPGAAYVAIGKVLARLEAPHSGSAPKAPVLSLAKAPIQPVGASPSADADDPTDDEPLEKHILRYNAADRKAGRR